MNNSKEVEHGEGVIVSKFGGEGTGFKSMKDVKWKNDEDVTLIVEGERMFVYRRFVEYVGQEGKGRFLNFRPQNIIQRRGGDMEMLVLVPPRGQG